MKVKYRQEDAGHSLGVGMVIGKRRKAFVITKNFLAILGICILGGAIWVYIIIHCMGYR